MQRATVTSELHTCYVWNDKQTRELITSWLKKEIGPKSGAAMAALAAAAPSPLPTRGNLKLAACMGFKM